MVEAVKIYDSNNGNPKVSKGNKQAERELQF